ncbi:hypothetical protein E2C01_011430 [Portunus trituberculatus]|uniref:Uncharacterized protein n=1 Tax=Portunus trituberculatus TaxID=210409 RepID=A0A5B7DBC9_PORTR|nr:hypothetical protein [Portunus trituberculatus]
MRKTNTEEFRTKRVLSPEKMKEGECSVQKGGCFIAKEENKDKCKMKRVEMPAPLHAGEGEEPSTAILEGANAEIIRRLTH